MTDNPDHPLPQPGSPPDAPLPPVQPPGTGFILQLFVIPMLIVAIVVTVWLMFSWMAHMGSRPDTLVQDLERLNEVTWQKALTLANMLRDPGNEGVRRDGGLSLRLANVLQRQIDQERMDREHIWFRMYLCRALGEFESENGLPALLRAASVERSPEEIAVRRAALQAIGRLIGHIGSATVESNDSLLDVLSKASTDRSEVPAERQSRVQLRSTAAFVLGLLQRPQFQERLTLMLGDPHPFTRYNAAIGLARHGDVRAISRLVEMLDPNNEALNDIESVEASEQEWNQQHVLINALRGVQQLAERNPTADLSKISMAVQRLLGAELNSALNIEVQHTLLILKHRKPSNRSVENS